MIRLQSWRALSLPTALLAASLALYGCTQVTQAETAVCGEVARLQTDPAIVAAVAIVNDLDPHSAISVLWADLKGSCKGGVPASGVSQAWIAMALAKLKQIWPGI